MKLLLDKGADVNTQGGRHGNATKRKKRSEFTNGTEGFGMELGLKLNAFQPCLHSNLRVATSTASALSRPSGRCPQSLSCLILARAVTQMNPPMTAA